MYIGDGMKRMNSVACHITLPCYHSLFDLLQNSCSLFFSISSDEQLERYMSNAWGGREGGREGG